MQNWSQNRKFSEKNGQKLKNGTFSPFFGVFLGFFRTFFAKICSGGRKFREFFFFFPNFLDFLRDLTRPDPAVPSRLGPVWTRPGPNLDPSGTGLGPGWDPSGTGLGPDLGPVWDPLVFTVGYQSGTDPGPDPAPD